MHTRLYICQCKDVPHICLKSVSKWVVLRKRAPMCDIELVALDLHIWVANRLVQCTTYTV